MKNFFKSNQSKNKAEAEEMNFEKNKKMADTEVVDQVQDTYFFDKNQTLPIFKDPEKHNEKTSKANDKKEEKSPIKKIFIKDDAEKKDPEKKTITFVYKRLVDNKLTILLIENTSKVAKEKDILNKIVKSLVSSGYVCIINYGSEVRQGEMFDVSSVDNLTLLCEEDIGDKACLYDALVCLESIVSKKYLSIEETEKERMRVNNIEIIGIGSSIDNCSIVSKDIGIDCLDRVKNNLNVTSKYFCLTENDFVSAAEIGFRSIGAISRNY